MGSSLSLSGVPILSPDPRASFSLFSGQKVRFLSRFSLQSEVARERRKWYFWIVGALFLSGDGFSLGVFGAGVATVAVL